MRCRYTGRLFLCYTILTPLAGCQPSGTEAPYENYLRTRGATLSVATPLATLPQPPPQRLLDTSRGSLEGLDFMALSDCAVQATVLKHNSSLGRAAKPSQRLLLELEFLELAPACIRQLRGRNNDTLADRLEEAWRLQREQLPALIFNATLGSDEYRAFWLATRAPGQYPRVSRAATAAALAAITNHTRRWLGGDYRAQNRDLEILLSEVAGGDGGALLQALSRQHDSLQLFPHIATLEAQLTTVLPQRYRSWMEDRNARLAKFANAQFGAQSPKIDYTEKIIGVMRSRP